MKDDNTMYNQYWSTIQSSSPPQLELKLFTSNYTYNGPKDTCTNTTSAFSLEFLSKPLYFFEKYNNSDNNKSDKSSIYWLHPKNSTIILSDDYKYPLLNDKKTFFEHLSTKQLSLCAVRTAGQQVALVFAHYFQDLMNYKMENDNLVWDDKLTEEEADEFVAAWEKREWTKRMKSIPEKIYQAFIKVQSVTLCMRYYEHALNQHRRTSIQLMDLLTKDPVAYSRRQAASTIITRYTNDYFNKLFYVCLWSNCIGHLSDYTVTQLYLVCKFWYDCYTIQKEKKIEDSEDDVSKTKFSIAIANAKNHFWKESSKVIMIRFVGWVFSSMTAAVGGIVYPKFGTLLGGNLGDSIISSALS